MWKTKLMLGFIAMLCVVFTPAICGTLFSCEAYQILAG